MTYPTHRSRSTGRLLDGFWSIALWLGRLCSSLTAGALAVPWAYKAAAGGIEFDLCFRLPLAAERAPAGWMGLAREGRELRLRFSCPVSTRALLSYGSLSWLGSPYWVLQGLARMGRACSSPPQEQTKVGCEGADVLHLGQGRLVVRFKCSLAFESSGIMKAFLSMCFLFILVSSDVPHLCYNFFYFQMGVSEVCPNGENSCFSDFTENDLGDYTEDRFLWGCTTNCTSGNYSFTTLNDASFYRTTHCCQDSYCNNQSMPDGSNHSDKVFKGCATRDFCNLARTSTDDDFFRNINQSQCCDPKAPPKHHQINPTLMSN
ncbi:Hypothetical predicted protein [Podarcis lilfordi]|uniref:UPAR/Ly6 domain-containing protein n=1 Tax=Podarcis lilfordi TaxID=74358 RepID=A0AA35QQ25_9SAUR|nr:Hypothetical predicted protein [Podarcis lilfordi]